MKSMSQLAGYIPQMEGTRNTTFSKSYNMKTGIFIYKYSPKLLPNHVISLLMETTTEFL